RQRGFWSFLTWPFILSDVVAAGVFFGIAAQATDQGDEGGGHGASHSNPAFDDISSTAPNGTTADDVQDDEVAYNGHSPRSVLNLHNLQFADNGIELQPASNDAGARASDGGGGGGGGGGSDSGDSGSSGAVSANFPGAVGANFPGADGSGIDLGGHVDQLSPFDVHGGTDGARGSGSADSGSSGAIGANFPGADSPGIDLGVHVEQLLGFDVRVGADGIFVGVDSAPWPDLNPSALISDLAQGLGVGGIDLHHLLGFDVHLGSDGFFVVSDLVQTANLNAGLDLTGILLPQHHGSSGLIDPSPLTGLPGLGTGSIGDVNTTLGLADGGFGLFSGVARVPASVPSAAGGVESIASDVLAGAGPAPSNGSSLIKSLAPSVSQSSDSASLSEIAPAHVVGDAASVDALASNGDLSSGATLNFPAGPLPQLDELFSGNRYTEYNMTLQAPSPDAGKIGVAPISNAVDHAAVSPAPVDVTPLSHNGNVPPLKAIADTNHPLDPTPTTTLDHTPTTTAELISHTI
ncbi:MAG TPA: hypothetical protein VK653_18600, partial [Xanthobacteraceae bacterium]|nr:hypothetical protein [Xanthobacteraceae bacterium]